MNARSNGISDDHAAQLHVADYDPAFVDPGHGNSKAGWVSVIVMLVATLFGTLFFVLDMPMLVWASVGLLVIGFLLWPILAKAGHGVQEH